MDGVTWGRSPIIRGVRWTLVCFYTSVYWWPPMYFSPVLNSSLSGYYRHIHIRWSQCMLNWPPLGWGSTHPACSTSRWEYGGVMDVMTVVQLWCFYWCDSLGETLLYPHYLQSYPWGRSQVTPKRVGYDYATSACRSQHWYCVILHCAIVSPSYYCVLFLIDLLPFVCNSLIIKLQFINRCFLSKPLKSHWMGETSFL